MVHAVRRSAGLMIALMVLSRHVNAQETGWLELTEGYEGEEMQATVDHVEDVDSDETRLVTISIPKRSFKDESKIEEVVVIGKKPRGNELLRGVTYEWVKDYDSERYGLLIKLRKDTNYPIRLYFDSSTEINLRQ